MKVQRVLLTFGVVVVALAELSGCGGTGRPTVGLAPNVPVYPTTLTGNWSIAGARDPLTYPIFSTSLIVHGSELSGKMSVQIECSPQFRVGGQVPLTGQIATDGSFQASVSLPGTSGSANAGLFQVSLSGISPAGSSSNWTGSYTLHSTARAVDGTSCAYSHSGDFTATAISPLTGTYTGPATGPLSPAGFGANAAISLAVSQEPPALLTSGQMSSYQLPLSATITVTGSPCFTSGTTTGTFLPSEIGGDMADLRFAMNDGSELDLQSVLNSPTGSSLTVLAVANGGACDRAIAQTMLTRS